MDASSNPPNADAVLTTTAAGAVTRRFIFTPQGMFIAGAARSDPPVQVNAPHLPWFRTVSQAWEEYRVLSVVFEFVPRLGSGTRGNLLIATSGDPADAQFGVTTTMVQLSGNTSMIPLDRQTPKRVPADIDNNWKSVSNTLTFRPPDWTQSVPVHSMKELSFCSAQVQVIGAPATAQSVGLLYMSIQVQFRGPRVGAGNA